MPAAGPLMALPADFESGRGGTMYKKDSDSSVWLAAVILATVVSAECSATADQQLAIPDIDEVYPLPRRATPDERRLIELVAKVSFNEAHDSYEDLALIWQVVEGHGETARERRIWLEHHSPCVSGRLTQEQAYARWEARGRSGNCIWTRNLLPNNRLPRGFTADAGIWHRNLASRWLEHIPRVRAFVMGEDAYRPCTETPQSWDGVRYGRDQVAPEGGRGRILECRMPYTQDSNEPGLHNFAVRYDAS